MKKSLYLFSALALVVSLSVSSCKKKKEEKAQQEQNEKTSKEGATASQESREAQAENETSVNEINQVISDNPKLSGRPADGGEARPTGICGLTIDSITQGNGVMLLTYNGTTCDNRTRTGSIKLSLQGYTTGTRWKNVGAVIKVEYNNYKVTRASDGASMMFNGTQFLTNVSGGNWWTLLILQTQPSLVTTITGSNLVVTYQDNTTATYNINRRLTYTISGSVITVKGEGIGNNGTFSDLENFGTTRIGDAFTSRVSTPIIWNTTCGAGAPLQGKLEIAVPAKNLTLEATYGIDISGNPVTVGPNQCAYGWKYLWSVNTASNTQIVKYN